VNDAPLASGLGIAGALRRSLRWPRAATKGRRLAAVARARRTESRILSEAILLQRDSATPGRRPGYELVGEAAARRKRVSGGDIEGESTTVSSARDGKGRHLGTIRNRSPSVEANAAPVAARLSEPGRREALMARQASRQHVGDLRPCLVAVEQRLCVVEAAS